MANWLSKLFSGGALNLAEGVANIVDRFKLTDEERQDFQLEMERLMQARDRELEMTIRSELQSKERVLVAELQSGDNYTRRARPTMAYFGMAVIGLNYIILPWAGYFFGGDSMPPPIVLPAEFWYAWGGVVATWSVGRTMERRGSQNNLVSIITGGKKETSSLLE